MDILIIVVLVIFSAVFSATETAFSSVNRIRLKNLASNGNTRAKIALDVIEKFDKALTAILVGNNVVNIASSALATVVFVKYFGQGGVGVATAVMTVTVLIFGEITPKGLAKEHAEGFVLFMAPILSGFMFIITPVLMPFIWLKRLVSSLFASKDKQPTMTEDELKYIIDEIQDEGVLEQQESDLVRSALEFDEKTVGEILVPRVNITGVDVNDNLDDIKQAFIESNYSRLPVFEDSIDNIIGVLLLGDFYKLYLEGGSDIRPILMEPAHLIEHTRVSQALKTMQKEKMHMAVVHDEYGGTQGIVTLEDIIEELVGEIYDESDTEDEQIYFKQISENEYEVDAEMSIYDMLERMELPGGFIESEMASLGGYVMELAGEIPQANEVVSDDKVDLTVLESDEHKIYRVKVKLREETKQDE